MKRIALNKPFLTPRLMVAFVEAAVGIGIVIYLWYHVALLFAPPFLVIESPARDIITGESTLPVFGITTKESHVFINDRETAVSREGVFTDTLVLQQGMNIIEIRSVNKFGKETKLKRLINKQ